MHNNAESKITALVLSAALLFMGAAFMASPASAESLNNVQVFATTSSSQVSGFQFAAYNLTGSLVASTQTSYPAAAFELPAGGYLFTVSATGFDNHIGYACPLEGGTTKGSGTSLPATQPNKSSSTSTPAILPVWCYPPSSEYGYATANVSGPQTVDIVMQNVSKLPTTPVTVKVAYVNGTAAADASVYASVVGEWYFWWGPNSSVIMGAQTDSNGIAHLVLPAAPSVVTAWEWIPLFSGSNGSTIQRMVGGQEINVTVYWQPTYIGLSGSGLILPPQNNINITLHYQQPNYWVLPANVASEGAYSGGASTGTAASRPSGVPSLASTSSGTQGSSQYYLPSQIPAIQQAAAIAPASGSQSALLGTNALTVASVAFVAAAIAVALVAARHRLHRPPSPIG